MKFTTSTAFVTALAALSSTTSANGCNRHNTGGLYTYTVWAEGVVDISGKCRGLWDNLKRFASCGASATYCGVAGDDNHLQWSFDVGRGCDGGAVESTWWEATRNQWGAIDCP